MNRYRREPARPERKAAPKNQRLNSGGLLDRLHAYGRNHLQTLVASLGQLVRAPMASTMTVLVIAIALSLPTAFYLLLANLQQVSGGFASSNQISLFLKADLNDRAGAALAERLRADSRLAEVTLIRKAEALAEFRSYSGFGEVLDTFGFNPLPVVIQLQPAEPHAAPAQVQALVGELGRFKEVDFAQWDMQWLQRLHSIMVIADRVVSLLAVLLGVAVVFIIGNTIRLELQNRREEIVITKLLGGTDRFIRRPFVYSGFWYGCLGGAAAWVLVLAMLLFLRGPVRRLSALYESQYSLTFLALEESLMLWGLASGLGVIAAWLTVTYHLRGLNPE